MKLIVILLICIVVVAAANEGHTGTKCLSSEFFRTAIYKCAVVHGVTEADIDDFVYLRWAASEPAKCFRTCILNACEAFNFDGSFVDISPLTVGYLTSRRDFSHWAVAESVTRYCVDILPIWKNRCNAAEAFIRCLTSNSPIRLSLVGAL